MRNEFSETDALAKRVKATNFLNSEALKLYDLVVPIWQQFVGQKIYKADGGLLKKVKDTIGAIPLPSGEKLRVYCYHTTYSIYYSLSTWENVDGESYSRSIATSLYVCDIDNSNILAKLYDKPELRTDYTAEEIAAARTEVERAEKMLSAAKSKLCGFGTSDYGNW